MEKIRGLLLKDLFVFKNYRKNIIFSMIVFVMVILLGSLSYDMVFTGITLFLLVFGLNSLSTFSYDENSEVDKYLLSLPLTRKEVVVGKYLFAFLNSFLILILGFIISVGSSTIVSGRIIDISKVLKNSMLLFTAVSYLLCINIPCIYKWGMEKGRMQAAILPVFIVFALGVIYFTLMILFPNIFNDSFLKMIYDISFILCIILNILMYYISFMISFNIYQNKDL